MDFADKLDKVLARVRAHVLAKNLAYGDSALNPVRIFSRSDADEALRVRLDDKLSRLARGQEAAFDENPSLDIMGYLVLMSMRDLDDTVDVGITPGWSGTVHCPIQSRHEGHTWESEHQHWFCPGTQD